MLAKKSESPVPVIGNEALKIDDTGKCLDRSFSQKPQGTQAHKRAAAVNTLLTLRQRFPAAIARLDLPSRRPLKVGIAAYIIAAIPEFTPADIGRALNVYVNGVAYLEACTEGTPRVGLDGKAAGVVTATEAAYAAKLVAKIKRKRRPTSPPASTASPKKISLSDLKAAARKRAAVIGGA
jgi:sRNA-binding protein